MTATNAASISPERTLRQRAVFVLRGFIIAITATLLTLPSLLGFMFISGITLNVCGVEINPLMQGWRTEDLRIPSYRGGETAAWYIYGQEPRQHALVIMAPTLGSARGYRYEEYVHYLRAGYDVFSMNSVNCHGAVTNSLGYSEIPQIGDALAWLDSRPDGLPDRIALHGFSAGGALATMAAARYEAIDAVVSEGGYGDFVAEMRQSTTANLPVIGGLFEFGASAAYRLIIGEDISVLSPQSVIGDLAIPVLLIYGTTEPALAAAREMQRRGQQVELWEIEDAGHGDYVYVAPDEYPRRVVGFLDRAFGISR
jgi:pimeloyl-ACP methyl ester carboxylesterase